MWVAGATCTSVFIVFASVLLKHALCVYSLLCWLELVGVGSLWSPFHARERERSAQRRTKAVLKMHRCEPYLVVWP